MRGVVAFTPASFVSKPPSWSAIPVREGLDYEDAWAEVVDVLARKFDLEEISKDGGYVRTSWIHNWENGRVHDETYRVRATAKFSPRRDAVDVKTEAQVRIEGTWQVGMDMRLMEEVRTSVQGAVGR